MESVPRKYRGEIVLKPNRFYRLSDNIRNIVLSCGLDFIPFALADKPDFDAGLLLGTLFIFDESSLLYQIKDNGWELWRFFDKEAFKFVTGWSYRPIKDEKVEPIWILNTCMDFQIITRNTK
jgi:hypothetical protein